MPINKSSSVVNQVEGSSFFRDAKGVGNINNSSNSNKKKLESAIVMKITDEHKKILENHFKNEKGLALSSGIRQIIFEYMKSNGLI